MAALNSIVRSNRADIPNTHRDWLRLVPDPPLSALSNVTQQDSGEGKVVAGVPAPQGVIRLVAGPFAELVSQIWSGQRISEYLTAPDARRHLWHAWLSSERIKFTAQNRMSADLAYDRLTLSKGRDLVIDAYGHQPPGVLKALARLGAEARSPEFYRALGRALSINGAGAKFLQHTPDLSDSIVIGLAGLPAGLVTSAIVDLLKRSRVVPEALRFFSWTLSRLETLLGPSVSHAVLQAPNPLEALWDVVLSLPFPEAPWSGTERAIPISSRCELQRIAGVFKNCLNAPDRQRNVIIQILNGERYLFEWKWSEPALIECRRIGQLGWYLEEISGPRNSYISRSTIEMVYDDFITAELFCLSRDYRPRYYDENELLRGLPI